MKKDRMFYRFALYGFLKNLRFFEPFMVLFFREGGLSFLQIGVLYSIRDLGTNLLELPAGVFADAFGRRKSMVLSFSAYIISFLVFFFFPNFYVYGLAMVVYALGDALRTGTHKALILEHLRIHHLQDLKVAYYGRTRAASQLGSALNALLAAALVFYSGNYRYIFVASILPYVLDLINLATYPKSLDGELAGLQRGALKTQVGATLRSFVRMFTEPDALRALLNSAGFTSFFKASKDYLQPILKTFALSLPLFLALEDTRRSAVVIGGVYFIIYLLTSYASRSSDSVSKRFTNLAQAINVTYVVGAVFLFIAGLASWQNLAVLSILIFLALYVLHNLRRPMNVAFISDQISHKVMASGLSAESQLTTLLMAVLAPLLGFLADRLNVGAALACLGGLMVLLVPLLWVRPAD